MDKDSQILVSYIDMDFDDDFQFNDASDCTSKEDNVKVENIINDDYFLQENSIQLPDIRDSELLDDYIHADVGKDNFGDVNIDDHFEGEVEGSVDYDYTITENEINIQSIIGDYDYKIVDNLSDRATGQVKIKMKKKLSMPSDLLYCAPDKRNTVKRITLEEFTNKLESDACNKTKKTSRKKTKEYCCNKCNKLFPKLADYRTHMIIHQKETKHKCPVCQKCFCKSADLVLHNRVHTGERPYACKFCQKAFTQEVNLIRHIRTHTNERPFSCHICDKKCIDKGTLNKHLLMHKKTPYFCRTCKEYFSNSNDFKKHTLVVHSLTNFLKCGVCSLCFPNVESRKQHTKDAHSEGFQCDVCEKWFQRKGFLTQHIMKHWPSHACKYCSKKFTSHSGLLSHIQRHVGYNPYVCKVCSFECESNSRLRRHMISHTNNRPFSCEICPRSFKTAQVRKIHMKHKHEQSTRNWKCEYRGCNLIYTTKNNMRRHMRIVHYRYRKYCCDICEKTFSDKFSLIGHLEQHSV